MFFQEGVSQNKLTRFLAPFQWLGR